MIYFNLYLFINFEQYKSTINKKIGSNINLRIIQGIYGDDNN